MGITSNAFSNANKILSSFENKIEKMRVEYFLTSVLEAFCCSDTSFKVDKIFLAG